MTSLPPDVLVIGAGVSGLTTAICLAEAGCAVTVAAADRPSRTTSAAAGAVWGPHLVGMDDRVEKWGAQTLARLTELAGDPATGVQLATGVMATRSEHSDPIDWVAAIDNTRPCDPAELPAGFAGGWRLAVPTVSMSVYLEYLLARLTRQAASCAPRRSPRWPGRRNSPAPRSSSTAPGSGRGGSCRIRT